jgi:hypothetical protein
MSNNFINSGSADPHSKNTFDGSIPKNLSVDPNPRTLSTTASTLAVLLIF